MCAALIRLSKSAPHFREANETREAHDKADGCIVVRCALCECCCALGGVVGIYRTECDNRRQITSFALPGDILEIATQGHHEVSAAAIGPAVVWEIPREK